MENESPLDELCINTIRMLSVDAIEQAKSGHPGMPMGAAAPAYVLWTKFLKHNPKNPSWPNRDRFILSAGHGSMLLYSLLHLTGYDLPLDEIKRFRQWGSKCPGHPEYKCAPGVEMTTGNLGQGFGAAVGMAIARDYLASHFNRPGFPIIDYYIYVLCSDGDIMEGVASESASLAGHLKLGKLIYIYDDNRITIEGSTELTFTEDVQKHFEACGWFVLRVDGNNLKEVSWAISEARKQTNRPSLIITRTHIGHGSPGKQDTHLAHGAPLGPEETRRTKENLKWFFEPFYIPPQALAHFRKAIEKGERWEAEWQGMLNEYAKAYPKLFEEWEMFMRGELPQGWDKDLPVFKPEDGPMATRTASGKTLSVLASRIFWLVGGSADLGTSVETYLREFDDYSPNKPGRNIHFGVREHAMGAIMNGMSLTGLIPYGGTFLVFFDYMKPPIRFACMMNLHNIYVFSHDSIGVGEDGPTHHPTEQLFSLRSIPNLTVIRPADANETVVAWKIAIERKRPVALILTRQKIPIIDRKKYPSAELVRKGAYVLADSTKGKIDLIIIATGSEVHPALAAWHMLSEEGIGARLVNMPSWEIFEEQPKEYKNQVLPPQIRKRLAVEAGSTLGWHKYVGLDGKVIGLDRFGASAPGHILMEKFGFTPQNIAAEALKLVKEETG